MDIWYQINELKLVHDTQEITFELIFMAISYIV